MLTLKRLAQKSHIQATLIKALAHPHRLSIFHLLSCADMRIQELTVHTGISPSLLEHHLAQLGAVGLVRKQMVGARPFYAINSKGMEGLKKLFTCLTS